MTQFILTRKPSSDYGTFGVLTDADGNQLCVTCERPWDDNQPQKSCIPIGNYPVIPHNSPSHPNTWEVTGVPGRSNILIHNGNLDTQSEGCILVGESFGVIDDDPAVLNSVATLEKLRGIFPDNFNLLIQ